MLSTPIWSNLSCAVDKCIVLKCSGSKSAGFYGLGVVALDSDESGVGLASAHDFVE